ncbi:hypothetical protein C8R42DRAFT_653095, partial [Lentinula raphanica]
MVHVQQSISNELRQEQDNNSVHYSGMRRFNLGLQDLHSIKQSCKFLFRLLLVFLALLLHPLALLLHPLLVFLVLLLHPLHPLFSPLSALLSPLLIFPCLCQDILVVPDVPPKFSPISVKPSPHCFQIVSIWIGLNINGLLAHGLHDIPGPILSRPICLPIRLILTKVPFQIPENLVKVRALRKKDPARVGCDHGVSKDAAPFVVCITLNHLKIPGLDDSLEKVGARPPTHVV